MDVTGNDGADLMSSSQAPTLAQPGLTVPQLARRYRVGPDTIRAWIRSGELPALNTAKRRCGRPRYVVTIDALAAFERGRRAATPEATEPKRRRRRKPVGQIDFYPD